MRKANEAAMKIGILGGTFNPIHEGHLALGEQFCHQLSLDKLLLVPANIPPHKDSSMLEDGLHRLAMCRLAIEDQPHFDVTDIELARDGKSFTVETLRQLKNTYPDDDLYLLVGSDMFFSFRTWKHYEEILSLATVCTAGREQGDYEKLLAYREEFCKDSQILVLDIEITPLSSSDIRTAIGEDKPFEQLVPYQVAEYIKQNRLYSYSKPYPYDLGTIAERLEELLDKERFHHTLCVAKQAVKLARIHGASEQHAIVAGLLHDIQKNTPFDLMLQRIENSAIILDNTFLKSKPIWHSMAGYIYSQSELNIQNIDILNAVRYHTTARKGMSELEKIIYLADKTSEDREYEDADRIRALSEASLDTAMLEALGFIISDFAMRKKLINQDTVEAYNELIAAETAHIL